MVAMASDMSTPGPDRSTSILLLGITCLLGTGVGLVFPLLAEIQDTFGFSTAGLGLISGSAFLSALIAGLFFAGLADRGHAKRLMVVGALLCAVSLLWFAIGTELWQFAAARSLEGLGLGIFTPAVRRVLTVANPADAGRQLGRLVSAELGGLILGPVVASVLTPIFSLDAPFVVVGLLALLSAVALALRPLPSVGVSEHRDSAWSASLRMATRPRSAGAALMSLALFLPVGIYDALWARYMTDRGASTAFIGITLSMYAIPVVLIAPFGGGLSDRFGAVRAAMFSMVAIVPITVLFGWLTVPIALAALAIVEAVPQAVAGPAVQMTMVDASDPSEMAAGQGLLNSTNQLGGAVVGFCAPSAYAAFGPGWLFTAAGIGMAVVFVAGFALHRQGERVQVPAV